MKKKIMYLMLLGIIGTSTLTGCGKNLSQSQKVSIEKSFGVSSVSEDNKDDEDISSSSNEQPDGVVQEANKNLYSSYELNEDSFKEMCGVLKLTPSDITGSVKESNPSIVKLLNAKSDETSEVQYNINYYEMQNEANANDIMHSIYKDVSSDIDAKDLNVNKDNIDTDGTFEVKALDSVVCAYTKGSNVLLITTNNEGEATIKDIINRFM